MTPVAFPLQVAPNGRTATDAGAADTAERLIEQLLLTAPGERLNRPTLGCGLVELLFGATSDELRAATEFQVATALRQWLADVVEIVSVRVGGHASAVQLTVQYRLARQTAVRTAVYRA